LERRIRERRVGFKFGPGTQEGESEREGSVIGRVDADSR